VLDFRLRFNHIRAIGLAGIDLTQSKMKGASVHKIDNPRDSPVFMVCIAAIFEKRFVASQMGQHFMGSIHFTRQVHGSLPTMADATIDCNFNYCNKKVLGFRTGSRLRRQTCENWLRDWKSEGTPE
jgi:hypothetical protein